METVFAYYSYSVGILFREGLEALLVVIALAAGTRSLGRDGREREIYLGALIAVFASILLAWAINHAISDDTSDALEGLFQMLAAGTLFYVSSWLTARSQSQHWMSFIKSRVKRAEKSRLPAFALGLTAFLAVMREGGETIVFFQALTAGAGATVEKQAVMAGILTAAAALIVVFFLLRKAADWIPFGTFFSVTSVLLYGLAIVFVGQGIASWQEARVIGATFVDYVPTIPMLGVFPTVQSITAQLMLLVLATAAILVPREWARRVEAEEQAPQSLGASSNPGGR